MDFIGLTFKSKYIDEVGAFVNKYYNYLIYSLTLPDFENNCCLFVETSKNGGEEKTKRDLLDINNFIKSLC